MWLYIYCYYNCCIIILKILRPCGHIVVVLQVSLSMCGSCVLHWPFCPASWCLVFVPMCVPGLGHMASSLILVCICYPVLASPGARHSELVSASPAPFRESCFWLPFPGLNSLLSFLSHPLFLGGGGSYN